MVIYNLYIIVTMYLRTSTRKNKDGSVVSYLQLAENVWDPQRKRSKAKIICTLGRADGKGVDRLKQLAASIRRHSSFEMIAATEPGWRFVNSWEHGAFYVLGVLWQRLGIGPLLEKAVWGEDRGIPFERAIFAMVANRSLAPASKLCCYQVWLAEDVYFPEASDIELHHLYRAMDLLFRHKERIEEDLFWRLADLLNVDVDLIFYDTTTIHFEIDEEDDGDDALRLRGRPSGGGDPQIVVGMAVTRDGLPVKSWVFPGNTADVTTIETVKNDLRGWRLNRCLWVADAGMVSEENLRKLASGGAHYIVAMRCIKGSEVVREVLTRAGRFHKVRHNLHVKEVWVGKGERRRRYVVCYNPKEAERQQEHRQRVLAQLEQELKSLKDPHCKRARELLTNRRYGRYLRRLKSGALRLSKQAIREAAKRDGLWVIHTNDDSLTSEDLALAYKQLMRVEESWKTMKSGLKVRPLLHRTPQRIKAHVFLCVLALLLERVAEKTCNETWRCIRNALRSIKVGQLLTPNGHLFQTSPVEGQARKFLQKLKITPPPEVLAVEQQPQRT